MTYRVYMIAPLIVALVLVAPSISFGGTVVQGVGESEICYSSEEYARHIAVLDAKNKTYDMCQDRGGVRRWGNPATRCFPCGSRGQYRCTAGVSAECRQ